MKRLVSFIVVITLFMVYQQIQIIQLQKEVHDNTVDIIWADDKAFKNKIAIDTLRFEMDTLQGDHNSLHNAWADHYKWHSIWD